MLGDSALRNFDSLTAERETDVSCSTARAFAMPGREVGAKRQGCCRPCASYAPDRARFDHDRPLVQFSHTPAALLLTVFRRDCLSSPGDFESKNYRSDRL